MHSQLQEAFKDVKIRQSEDGTTTKIGDIIAFTDTEGNNRVGKVQFSEDLFRFEVAILRHGGDARNEDDFCDDFISFSTESIPSYMVIKLDDETNIAYIESVETDNVSIDIYECDCGYHMGVDSTYLDQVGNIETKCPSCKKDVFIKKYD